MGEVVQMARAAVDPSFDDYVAARGVHLLRMAWLLTGDSRGARELVEVALARALPHWRNVSEQDDGLYDAYVRRAMMATFLEHPRGRWRRRSPAVPDATDGQPDVHNALAALRPAHRAVAVLRYYENLDERQAAEVLDCSVRAVRSRSAAVRKGLDLGNALVEAVPESPATDGLADDARRYAVRARRVRAAGVAGLVAVLAAGGVAASGAFRDHVVGPALPRLSCAMDSPDLPLAPLSGARPLSASVREVLVCADRSDASAWVGSLPPDDPVSGTVALDYLRFDPRGVDGPCAALPSGVAYRMLVQGLDGRVAAYDNQRLACNGWPALDRYFIALGDQLSAQWGTASADPFLPCTSVLSKAFTRDSDLAAGLPKGTTVSQATACFHPVPDPTDLPVQVLPVTRRVLGVEEVALLNADLARSGSSVTGRGRATCAPIVRGRVVLHVRTTNGRVLSLVELCGNRGVMAVNWNLADQLVLSRGSYEMVLSALGRG
ncbi:MAG TPA: sigma factor-like helix-turn-helix DNA-binding protein [Pedococcus sp.]|nr:sigma factor-like helix-turn-helix DNA-binding protein [Pedococcus sp.]